MLPCELWGGFNNDVSTWVFETENKFVELREQRTQSPRIREKKLPIFLSGTVRKVSLKKAKKKE